MTLRDLRRRLDRICEAVRRHDWFGELTAPDTIVVGLNDQDPPDLDAFIAAGGVVLRPDEPIPQQPIL